MPRPKRTKITSATTRVSKHAPRTEVAKPAATKLSKAKQNAKTFSDDSDGLVVKSKTTRSTRGQPLGKTHEPVVEADLEMTGALPVAEGSPAETPKDRTPASKASKRTRGTRLSGRQILSSTAKSASTRSPVEVAQEEAAQEGDTSGFGDLTFSSFGSESPLHGTRPPSAMKVGATPAHEASILALTNFKRRARQPSLLRMVQQTTDVEDNDQSGLDDTDNFDFDDFLPHAESTPLNVRKPVAEDDARNDSGTQISSSGSRGVKRKLTPVVQVPRSSPPCDPPSGAGRPSKKAPTYAESEGEETEAPKKAKRTAKSKAQQKISTAQLKVLLPRRRNRNLRDRDEFDIDSSEATPIDSEQDELQMPNPRARQRGSAKVASPKAAKKNARGTKATASRQSKTYSRRISSDKENDARNDGDEEPTEASVAEHSEKLLAIKKKFEEVDAFELDFETGDVTTSSSPFR
ncbi:hypothetical protein SNOG_12763 [Parastagonospora nodorum SN15]|uniref:Uncharacterized protein n=1 Tax=Phaeosphaeria nodorum (strain SN15 / ATCC MYA-4574 / FGSC 10173) TaxID=321614 RepID=Q0U651_PHANO|nr:hypothetical protein SNOG_12763 [Parastagonospora nodorum SN15]EAT80061.2 hypothetical protein SNOG_12763 [Parastagonospora nodorum SN15]